MSNNPILKLDGGDGQPPSGGCLNCGNLIWRPEDTLCANCLLNERKEIYGSNNITIPVRTGNSDKGSV